MAARDPPTLHPIAVRCAHFTAIGLRAGGPLCQALAELGESVLNADEFVKMCNISGITIADSALGIGRELSFENDPLRILVVQFGDADFPKAWKNVMKCILKRQDSWVLVNRYGGFQARVFAQGEIDDVLNILVKSQETYDFVRDDHYLVGFRVPVIITCDHHMLDDGMPIYLNNVHEAGYILCDLNELGAEVDLYSKQG